MDINKRNLDLQNLQSYLQTVDKEVTMVLQSLQWDRKHLLEGKDLVSCSHDPNHKIPPDKREEHERNCILSSHGYSREDDLLPDPVDPHAPTLVKHSKMEIQSIIQGASNSAPSFKMGKYSLKFTGKLSLHEILCNKMNYCISVWLKIFIYFKIVSFCEYTFLFNPRQPALPWVKLITTKHVVCQSFVSGQHCIYGLVIIKYKTKSNNHIPIHIEGAGSPASPEPLSLSRLQATYTADERRALHDAVVAAAPEQGDVAELALMSVEERTQARAASKLELLAQLRDMKRRRARYRGAAGSARYSDTLRDLIKTQMELYTGVKNEPDVDKTSVGINSQTNSKQHSGYELGNEAMQSREPNQSNKGREYDTKRREPSKEQGRYAKAEIRARDRKQDSRSHCSKDRNYESYAKETSSKWHKDNESYKTHKGHYRNDYDYKREAGSSHSSRSNRYDDYEVKQKHRTESYSKSRREYSRDRSRVRVKVESSPSRSAQQAASVEDKKSRYEESDRRRKDSKKYSRHKSDKSKVESSSGNTQEQTVYEKEDSKSRHDTSYKRQENAKEHSRSKKNKHKSHRDDRERRRSADSEPDIKQELHTRYYDCEDGE
ncbi:serine/arginine-rich splicing factor 11-like [Plutella xylostella]|uniref:serine/arginine-rich splicing factor 11-like n=1 Tax=Plutella xylostella TaxID=51655 RepID=UPI002032D5B0|nr:serine/arginine-rich splicing factor 11-like [Plutella xylostella]